MTLTTAQKWRRILTWLRRNFPAQHPVTVRSKPLKFHGECNFKDEKFFIDINSKKSFGLRIDTIIHEWAHAITWFGAEMRTEDHSAEWGLAYARIYRTFIEWNYGREKREDE